MIGKDETPLFTQFTAPESLPDGLAAALAECWTEVSDAGGAAGFPFPPVDPAEVAAAVDRIVTGLAPASSRLVVATVDGALAGWLCLRRDTHPLVAHWGTLHHVQTRLGVRGRGIGAGLVRSARAIAREEMGLEQLRLAARGGVGLEEFYGRLGWREIGRWPGALRLAAGDDRDEILMVLTPL
ncbi:GNAT family N-acetyltransferase [Streptomyces globisporus]|uniref:GNAT family N-acetyltransferase n=1 Tax=Streptomyces globisporus TaxID=1908 RepID=UPI0004C91C11|nr:GNAT family N-acetyltransferase [Streptomyces globisporus]